MTRRIVIVLAAAAVALGASAAGVAATERAGAVLADPGCCRGG